MAGEGTTDHRTAATTVAVAHERMMFILTP
jgi:hypothetical protein